MSNESEKRRAYMKEWHAKHPTYRREYMQEYYAANRSEWNSKRDSDYNRRYYAANRAKIRAYARDHPEPQQKWHVKNPQKRLEAARRLRASKPEVYREYVRARRARLIGAYVMFVSGSQIYERDKGVCQICNLSCTLEDFSLDHRIPLSKGGTHEPDNVQTAHRICNSRKHNKIV